MRVILISALFCGIGYTQGWPGYLVDARCYASEEENVNHTQNGTDRNVGFEISFCHPTAKTRSFVFIQQDGNRFHLDSVGNVKAAQFVRANVREARGLVGISGTKTEGTIRVTSFSSGR
jgi:hypothetical protein